MLRTLDFCNWLRGENAVELAHQCRNDSLIRQRIAGYFELSFTKVHIRGALSDTAMPIRPTHLPSSEAPKCVLPRREPLTGPSEKLTESGSAASKSSDRSRHRKSPSPPRRIPMATPDRTAQATGSPDCET